MANQELTVEEKLRQLYNLQTADSKIDEIKILKGELPIEVSDLEDEIVGLDTRIKKLQDDADLLEKDVAGHQTTIQESEALIEKYERQLENVKNNREYDALTKELELQRLEIQLSDKKISEVRVNIKAKQEVLDEAKSKIEKKNKDLELKKVELTEIIEKTVKEEEGLKKVSDKLRKNVETRLLKAYDKIRGSYRNGLSVVTVKRDACGGCFNKIPPQVQLEISMRKKIIVCEHCGRILVDDEVNESN